MTPFGKFLRRERQERGLLLGTMADQLKISTPYLSQVETGKRAIPAGFEDKVIRLLGLSQQEANELHRLAAISRTEFEIAISEGASDDDRTLAHDLALSFARLSPEAKDRLRDIIRGSNDA